MDPVFFDLLYYGENNCGGVHKGSAGHRDNNVERAEEGLVADRER